MPLYDVPKGPFLIIEVSDFLKFIKEFNGDVAI
jgi:hypothetical protein